MGQQQSKDELLYQQVSYGNIEGIKSLRAEGAGLEYVDKEGKTPLIVACMNLTLYNVAKTLIELGANINAYRPGRNGGTPLHHAAKRGLEETVKLLLSHGANALLMNDDCQTPLEVARAKGFANVVRTIESHICLYSGWLREIYGPGFLEILAPQLLSRKVWVVVLPCGSRNLNKPFKLELAIYASQQDAQPRTTIALWRANMEEPNFNLADPAVVISEASTKARVKLAPLSESDKQQLQQFCSACKGIPQVMHATFPFNTTPPMAPPTAPPAGPIAAPLALAAPASGLPPKLADPAEDLELSMAINASIQTAMEEGVPLVYTQGTAGPSSSGGSVDPVSVNYQNAPAPEKGSCAEQLVKEAGPSSTLTVTSVDNQTPMPAPSAPAISDEVLPDGPIHYPTIDSSPVDLLNPASEKDHAPGDATKLGESSSCVICFDAPVEGACVPCGHMGGCMSCLNEIKVKKWGCPVCRTQIDQVIRVYSV
uniref:RING-type domain-containing protein n=1 Tax=Opuntia streptacantha TaxID=393608 RepID=A0A7C9CY52_OPUST